jgi:hypothetical protein
MFRQIAKLLLQKPSARAELPALGIEADILFAGSEYRALRKKIVAESPT